MMMMMLPVDSTNKLLLSSEIGTVLSVCSENILFEAFSAKVCWIFMAVFQHGMQV